MVSILSQRLPTLQDALGCISSLNGFIRDEWTILYHDTHAEVATFNGFLDYNFNSPSVVPSQNIEEGSFTNYNKINQPFEMTVTLIKTGYPIEIEETLLKLEQLKNSTRTVDIVLPYRTYKNLNIKNLNHARNEGSSINLLLIELQMVEIRERSQAYSNTALKYGEIANPSDASTVSLGKQQPETVQASWLSKIARRLF